MAQEMAIDAVVRNFEIIGEAAKEFLKNLNQRTLRLIGVK